MILAVVVLAVACVDDASESPSAEAADTVPPSTTAVATSSPPTTTTTTVAPDRPKTLGLSGDITPSPDPDIAREGDWYYVFTTGHGVPIRRSQDLVHWEDAGSVFAEPHPAWIGEYDWVAEGDHLGAPDVEFFGGRWHLYYHSHRFASNNAITGHASTLTLDQASPDYDWIDDGLVMSSNDVDHTYSVLDANAVVDENGDPWLSFGSFWDGVQIGRLNADTGAPLDEDFTLLAGRDPWVLGVEASSMTYHDGFWYLFVSWGFCCQGVDTNYEIRVGRSEEITGPYVDIAGDPMLINGGSLLLGSYDRVIGTGSGDVLVTGDDSLIVHHWYDPENDGEVTLGVRPLLWSPDGWPVAADPGFVPADSGAITDDVIGVWTLSQYQSSTPATIELLADGAIAGDIGQWMLDSNTGVVNLELTDCAALAGASHVFFVGSGGDSEMTGFGHSDAALPVRAARTEGAELTCAVPAPAE
ncbi:MAG: arabinan endo-1,5-alpha-L-arabinosidase [Candidatus Aldehydirespiratoraceae bacterium]|jgi:arabinan endo-1,5-alpha-L-arabinosidase